MANIRGTSSAPGVYTKITDLSYAAKTMGITTLGVVGETLKGPAFSPVMVSTRTEFRDMFGGQSAEKYADSNYPRYELPYIANSYLTKSDQLYVTRVLGLSGYNAGPAFIITAQSGDTGNKHVVAVLRSRGAYDKYSPESKCGSESNYDKIQFECDAVELGKYVSLEYIINGCDDGNKSVTDGDYKVNALNLGQFTIIAKKDGKEVGRYPVSLNAGSKDYIYNVLGSKANDGSAALFVEELYDLNLQKLVADNKVDRITSAVTAVKEIVITPVCEPVDDFLTVPAEALTRSNIGKTYLANGTVSGYTAGQVYKVVAKNENGKRKYNYNEVSGATVGNIVSTTGETYSTANAVLVNSIDAFAYLKSGNTVDTLISFSDYHSQYRGAQTPWIVSEIKGFDKDTIELKKLFRFYTISDGDVSNSEVKISIANVRPDDGTFDVLVRDYWDSDANPTILESFRGLNMVPGNAKYIGLKIGTLDGTYPRKSKYIVVDVIENDITEQCVPGGFLGYPTRKYDGLTAPSFVYNTLLDGDVKTKRQYFGLSDITGVDLDMLTFKGKDAYRTEDEDAFTDGFHLDSTLNKNVRDFLSSGVTVSIDGEKFNKWQAVSPNNEGERPVLASEASMAGTIYEDVNARKFTVYFYGGFDGWDVYRNSRTTGDEFRANKYKGQIKNGYGSTFSKIQDGEGLGLTGNAITSDYYAWLAGAMQFADKERTIINLFATPGIDYVNANLLSNDILDMIEDQRKDALYVMTTPDKPWGATDATDDMYSPKDASGNLEDAGIDSYYAATYYPWVKFFDDENNRYINLPATKDVLRNMADVDNKSYPWYAPAGKERGKVECTRLHSYLKVDDESDLYDGHINPLKSFSKDGVIVWGDKTMYSQDTPMNRVNTVRLMLYMQKLITDSVIGLIFEPNDTTLANEFRSIVEPILSNIKDNRGITDYRLDVSQTAEEMDAHELNCKLWVKPTPTLEYIQIEFVVAPQGVEFGAIA